MTGEWWGQNIPKLGFGLMRLPKNADGSINLEQTNEMVDLFIGQGLTYFDTAFVYDQGESEKAVFECIVKRHPRKSFTLATKLMVEGCATEEEAKNEFNISLERTGAGYFDYYMLHAINSGNYEKYNAFHLWDYVKELKEKGLIKHYGFSFHDKPEVLDKILSEHEDVGFVQLQLNYADWESENIQARKCYEVARKHNKSIVVMEPLKGGALANPPENVLKVLKDANPDASAASWGIRYVAGMEGIITVLSGMSSVEQMKDNLSYMSKFEPLNEAEKAVMEKAKEEVKNIKGIACTGCHYCTDGCPASIPIPEIIAAENIWITKMDKWWAKSDYRKAVEAEGKSKASDCAKCGQCETMCPQKLPIVEIMRQCAADLE